MAPHGSYVSLREDEGRREQPPLALSNRAHRVPLLMLVWMVAS